MTIIKVWGRKRNNLKSKDLKNKKIKKAIIGFFHTITRTKTSSSSVSLSLSLPTVSCCNLSLSPCGHSLHCIFLALLSLFFRQIFLWFTSFPRMIGKILLFPPLLRASSVWILLFPTDNSNSNHASSVIVFFFPFLVLFVANLMLKWLK